tara:strand:+ start:4741 stop:5013 length:273 start_codon:yes stop_codon:yes gene_type:complete
MIDSIITINNVKMSKRDVIREIKGYRSATFHKAETIRNEKDRIVAQRFHFAAPVETSERIQDFFELEATKKTAHTYYLEFDASPNAFKRR